MAELGNSIMFKKHQEKKKKNECTKVIGLVNFHYMAAVPDWRV